MRRQAVLGDAVPRSALPCFAERNQASLATCGWGLWIVRAQPWANHASRPSSEYTNWRLLSKARQKRHQLQAASESSNSGVGLEHAGQHAGQYPRRSPGGICASTVAWPQR